MKKLQILLITLLVIVSACNSTPKQNYDSLANCLAEKSVKEYGAFWCPNCAQQKKMFGDSFQILENKGVYIECDPRCVKNKDGKLPIACNGIEGQSQLCIDKKVEKYPDWEFSDGSRLVGVQELSILADKAGCVI